MVGSAPAEAQVQYPLFDKYSFTAEFSWVGLATDIRLGSDLTADNGTSLLAADLSMDIFDFSIVARVRF